MEESAQQSVKHHIQLTENAQLKIKIKNLTGMTNFLQ